MGWVAGAILSEEHLVLNLAPFYWQKIAGAPASLTTYCTGVDESLRNVPAMLTEDEATFESIFGGCLVRNFAEVMHHTLAL